jgi:hypothetical protein
MSAHDRGEQALTDAEFWILLSLDAESPFSELLKPIVRHEDGESREIRPALAVADAQQALTRLVAGGLVEVLAVTENDRNEWPTVADDVALAIVDDRTNWEGTFEQTRYWAEITEAGAAAYRRMSEALHGPWPEGVEPRKHERRRDRLSVSWLRTMPVALRDWWRTHRPRGST